MNEMATLATDWYLHDWDESFIDEDPREHLHEYIISPEPFCETYFDEGVND